MNIRIVGNYLGKILMLDSVCMIPALIIAVAKGENLSTVAFAITIAVQLAAGFLLANIRLRNVRMYAKEGAVIVALSWVLISLFGAIPMCISGGIPSYLDALFETISGFTTTGATILADVEALPMSVLYWRSFTHWMGGMGVLVLLLALMPSVREGGTPLHILRAESPGPSVGKFAPKLYFTARILYVIYIVMTLLEVVFLLIGDMPLFDAVTTAFGTAGTGGFSIRNSSIADYSSYCQTVVAIFMMLFGINFSIYFFVLIRDFQDIRKNTELRVYLLIIAVSTAAITVCLKFASAFSGVGETIHHAFFQVVSIMTTTGFCTVDYNTWPEFTHEILLILMVIGACAGSTGGGLKVSRAIILFKVSKAEMRKIIRPRSVYVTTIDGKPLEKGTAERCFSFFFVYMAIIAASVLILSIEPQSAFKTNFSAVLACINNIGPGMDAVGPAANYGFLSPLSKIVLMLDMLLGRLELFPLILTFLPSTWSRKKI